ncbi:MAG: hypothetical protein Q7R32_00750 [Dehalococcoidia bacterium]|nr:hypothetical protein [Dehalococcoidia bacterium]
MSFGRWGMKGLVLVAALALLVALLAACKSDSKGGKTPTSDKTPASSETPTDGGGGGDGGDGGVQDLADLASQAAEGVTANVTYQYTSEAGGQTAEQEWVMVQRPPDSRFEIVSTDGGLESRTIVITTADKSYSCISAGSSGTCFDITDETQDQTAPFAALLGFPQTVADDISGLGAVDKSEREIAGVHANCFSADAVALGGASEFCFSDEGILLLLRSEAGGTSFTFEAKSVSTDVTDADFEPPYEIIDIPTG